MASPVLDSPRSRQHLHPLSLNCSVDILHGNFICVTSITMTCDPRYRNLSSFLRL